MGEGDSEVGTGEVMGRQRGGCVSLCTRAIYHTVRIEFSISCGDGQTIVGFLRLGTTLQLRCRRRSHQPPFSFSLLARLFFTLTQPWSSFPVYSLLACDLDHGRDMYSPFPVRSPRKGLIASCPKKIHSYNAHQRSHKGKVSEQKKEQKKSCPPPNPRPRTPEQRWREHTVLWWVLYMIPRKTMGCVPLLDRYVWHVMC